MNTRESNAVHIGTVAMMIAMHLDYRLLRKPAVAYGLMALALVLLVAVLFSPLINNTRRWFVLGGFSFQPAEFAKLGIHRDLEFRAVLGVHQPQSAIQ